MEKTLKATNNDIKDIVKQEIERLGNVADLNHIDVSGVTDMKGLFAHNQYIDSNSHCNVWSRFNGNISRWDVSNVTDMCEMFQGSEFNGDISNWNVENVKDMKRTFKGSDFKKDISSWQINTNCIVTGIFNHCNIPERHKPKNL